MSRYTVKAWRPGDVPELKARIRELEGMVFEDVSPCEFICSLSACKVARFWDDLVADMKGAP